MGILGSISILLIQPHSLINNYPNNFNHQSFKHYPIVGIKKQGVLGEVINNYLILHQPMLQF